MAISGIKTWFLLLIFMKLKLLVVIKGQQQVPCFFIFGDSLFDNGNNNNLITAAKANYPPYGIDFPNGPTGRFTNGKNTADFLAGSLGFTNPIQPFATASGAEILRGVNYASGAAGIRDETGIHLGDRISLNRQLANHLVTISRMTILLRNKTLIKENLRKCIYIVGMGNNDYINNYLMPNFYPSSTLFTPQQFATRLIQQYKTQLQTLYNLGARKVAVFGLGQLGCIPALKQNNSPACVESINNAVKQFEDKVKPMIDDLNTNLANANFTYINTTSISIGDPSTIGITNVLDPCCEISTTIAKGQCRVGGSTCPNRAQNFFWDEFHPSEIANQVTANRAYTAFLSTDASPFDISQLAQH